MNRADLSAWCAGRAAAFRDHERTLIDPSDTPRDEAFAEWLLRSLADPATPGSADVLEEIDRRRAILAHIEKRYSEVPA